MYLQMLNNYLLEKICLFFWEEIYYSPIMVCMMNLNSNINVLTNIKQLCIRENMFIFYKKWNLLLSYDSTCASRYEK